MSTRSLPRRACRRTAVLGLWMIVLAAAGCGEPEATLVLPERSRETHAVSVCPPFALRNEAGAPIDPVRGVNAAAPYSPRQTCGAVGCHDYEKITRGFHFQMGRGETPTADQAARIQWVSTPGFYGGSWCSPAPLYNYLSPKRNEQAVTMDLTSYTLLAKGCAQCHPGGGFAEFDRDGRRYDHWMADPASGLTSGGTNHLDGDYYKARWTESGVLEADCLLCHLPAYQYGQRKAQLAAQNFRWAATAGSGLARVAGSVKDGVPLSVTYDRQRFDSEGRLVLKMVREPRNETCLECHAQPGWKKRGANYSPRTDVHLRAGLRCTDCHAGGEAALDPRIRGREEHQFGKGDDPGGQVRNDLDNTVVGCADCHDTGRRGAPMARHPWLPRLHLDRLACQTCHIPERAVMPASVQASDVFNADARIPGTTKRLWSFYGPDGVYRNHYGILDMAGYEHKPTEAFRPVYVRYKGRIYPANRLHTAWPAIETAGKPGLMQPRMDAIYRMWSEHRKDPTRFPELARITDDSGDGTPEINRAEEIDALIAAVTGLLREIGWPLEDSRVVWVQNERVYASGTEYRRLPKHDHEASPYGNVHTYNHDVAPARAALGSGGCRDCHASDSPFYHQAVLVRPFDAEGRPEWVPNHEILGYSRRAVAISAWRESTLKPAGPWFLAAVVLGCLLHLVIFGRRRLPAACAEPMVVRHGRGARLGHLLALATFLFLAATGVSFLLGKASPLGDTARQLHGYAGYAFAAGVVVVLLVWVKSAWFASYDWRWLRHLGGYFGFMGPLRAGKFNLGQKIFFWLAVVCGLGLGATGILMHQSHEFAAWLPLVYTIHDALAIVLVALVLAHAYLGLVAVPGSTSAIFEGGVSAAWARHHHPDWTLEPPVGLERRSAPEEK